LRAERQGGGNGRVYTLNLATIDESDNIGRTGYQVHVPHNKKSVAIDDGSVFTVGGCDLVLPRSQTAATSIQPETAGLAPEEIPATYRLEQNYPNPFNPTTDITFDLPEAVHVLLEVYDVTGRRVARLVDTQMPAGQHRVTFDAARLPSGVYLYRLTAGSFSRSHHMVLTK
ncbi:MAG: T9SS type A sorting domain-containing protein, partial [Rhodothermales bacterium]